MINGDRQRAVAEVCSELHRNDPHPTEILYHEAFSKRLTEAAGGSSDTMRLLADVFSMLLAADHLKPFMPLASLGDRRTFLPGDLTDEQLGEVEAIGSACEEPVFVARVSDVLWIRAKDHTAARRAVAAYVEAASLDRDSWVPRRDYLRRATQIAKHLGRRGPEIELVKAALADQFNKAKAACTGAERGFEAAAFGEILIEQELAADWERLGEDCVEIARRFPMAPGCDEPRRYYELAAMCFDRGQLVEKSRTARLALAEHWEAEARLFQHGFLRAHRLENAIAAYRRVGGQQAKVAELMEGLREANRSGVAGMTATALEVDVTALILATRKAMDGKTGREALACFVGLYTPGSFEHAYTAASAELQDGGLHRLFRAQIVTTEGNVAANIPGRSDDEEANRRAAVVQTYNMRQNFVGGTVLEEARKLIVNDGSAGWQDAVNRLIASCAVVPEGRREIFASAIHDAFSGSGLVFAHLIVPQLENSLRILYESAGIQISSIDSQGVQEERDLNQLLRDEAGEAVLGQDFVWELRSFLTENQFEEPIGPRAARYRAVPETRDRQDPEEMTAPGSNRQHLEIRRWAAGGARQP